MSIAIFQEITTEEYLLEIEAEGKKCTGLYADMSDAPQRKFIKDQAANIKGMIKRLDRARIDKKAAYGASLDKEAAAIKQRLEDANSTYTLLIDAYAADCKKIRDAEKAIEDAKVLAAQIESDHEYALLIDFNVMAERAAVIQAQKEREDLIAKEAAENARKEEEQKRIDAENKAKNDAEASRQREENAKLALQLAENNRIAAEAKAVQDAIDAEERQKVAVKQAKEKVKQDAYNARIADEAAQAKREANKKHCASINNKVLDALIGCGITREQGKEIIKKIVKGEVPSTSIQY